MPRSAAQNERIRASQQAAILAAARAVFARRGLAATIDEVKQAPNIELAGGHLSPEDESTLYHHYRLNYEPSSRESGKRLVRH